MSDSLLRQVALVSESDRISPSDVAKVSAALQKQATRDVVQFWDVKATVDSFPKLEDVPIGYWPIVVKDDIDTPGAAGVHEDADGQPFALVTARDQIDEWSLTASHEMIEMLVDPFGNRLVAGDSPKEDQGRVEILVEACDPSEDARFGYSINGIKVSDFYSPRFFDPVAAQGVRYSFTGAIAEPRQVLRGGYLSWHDLASDDWWQEVWFDGEAPMFRNLGRLNARDGSLRSQVDLLTAAPRPAAARASVMAAGLPIATVDRATANRAAKLRAQIETLTAAGAAQAEVAKDAAARAERGRKPQRGARGSVPGLRRPPTLTD